MEKVPCEFEHLFTSGPSTLHIWLLNQSHLYFFLKYCILANPLLPFNEHSINIIYFLLSRVKPTLITLFFFLHLICKFKDFNMTYYSNEQNPAQEKMT